MLKQEILEVLESLKENSKNHISEENGEGNIVWQRDLIALDIAIKCVQESFQNKGVTPLQDDVNTIASELSNWQYKTLYFLDEDNLNLSDLFELGRTWNYDAPESFNEYKKSVYDDVTRYLEMLINTMSENLEEWSDYDETFPSSTANYGFIYNGVKYRTGYTGVSGNYWGTILG